MLYDEVTKKYLEQLKKDIADKITTKGINDTGGMVNSLEVNGNKLLANNYLWYLDTGRRPGTFAPVNIIRDWVRRKLGIEEKKVNSVAYLVNRNMKEKGTSIWRDKSKGIELDKMVDDMLANLYKELPNVAIIEVKKWL